MVDNIKPFYVYEENNCLFVKNINEKIDKIATNVVTYAANFDDKNFIHICCINTKGKLVHFVYKNGKFKKRTLCKVCNNLSNLKNMRLFIIKNYLNIFLVEQSSLKDKCYRISHFNFSPNNYNIQKHHFNNTIKTDDYIYRLNIDDMDNIIFTYNFFDKNKRGTLNTQTFIFNNHNRRWSQTHSLLRSSSSDLNSSSTIKDDIFEFCYSIIYKD